MGEQNNSFKDKQKIAGSSLRGALIAISTLTAAMFIFEFVGAWVLAFIYFPRLISSLDNGDSIVGFLHYIYFATLIVLLFIINKKKPAIINSVIYIIMTMLLGIYVWVISAPDYSPRASNYFPGLATVLQTILIILLNKIRYSKDLIVISIIFSLLYLSMYFIIVININ